jgi:cell cycle sensor histidine kinase DivJ
VRNGLSTQYLKSAITNFAQMPSLRRFGKIDDENFETPGDQHVATDANIAAGKLIQNLTPEAILKNLPSCISSLDANGEWNNITDGSCECFSSIGSRNFNEWVSESVHVQDRVVILKAVDDCRASGQNVIAEFRLIDNTNRENSSKWVEITCTSISYEKTILTILVDVTQRKLLEKQILKAQELSEAANLEKSKFLANMSHELRTPLNAIIGFSEILKCGMVPASHVEKQHEYHSLINESAMHLLNVLNDILDMSKIEAGKYEIYPEKIELTQIISSCISMLKPLADKAGVKLRFDNNEDKLSLEADSKAIRQILINLISNAIKFSNHGAEILISAKRSGSKIVWQIKDQGQGISAKNLEHLGEPFQQIDGRKNRKHEGTGLGLSIVKGLISLHGGKFKIESELGIGTTVTVELPCSSMASAPVPYEDVDTIIKIKPFPGEQEQLKPDLSRLVG